MEKTLPPKHSSLQIQKNPKHPHSTEQTRNENRDKKKSTIAKIQPSPHCLSNIVELTEENEPQGTTVVLQNIQNAKKSDMITVTKDKSQDNRNQNTKVNFVMDLFADFFRKSLNCLAYTYTKFYKQVTSEEINIEQSQISEILSKLRKKKSRKLSLLPEPSSSESRRRTLVLDLDQTLIYTTYKKPQKYDHHIQVQNKGTKMPLYIIKRFGLDSFLFEMSQNYEIVIFSSSKGSFIEKIIQKIDPKKYISHVLAREHCIVINKSYYIKSVRDLGRNPQDVIVVDSHAISASLNPQNLYKIDPFRGSQKDRKLVKLGYFLKYLTENKDIKEVVPIEMFRRQFESKQIKISEKFNKENINKENIGNFLKKKQYSHKKKSSEFESLMNEQQTSQGFFSKKQNC